MIVFLGSCHKSNATGIHWVTFQDVQNGEKVDDSEKLAGTISDLRARLEAENGLSDAIKKQIDTLIQSAESNLTRASEYSSRQKLDDAAANEVEASAKKLAEEIAQPKEDLPAPIDSAMTIDEIDRTVNELRRNLADLNLKLTQVESEVTRRAGQRQNIRVALQTYDQRVEDVQESLKSLNGGTDSLQTKATRVELETRLAMLQAEKPALLSEQNRYESAESADYLRLQKEAISRKVSSAQTRLTELEKLQTSKRQLAADRAAKEAIDAQAALTKKNPLLSSSYEINTRLAIRLQEIEVKSAETKTKLDTQKKLLDGPDGLRSQYLETRKRVDKIGLTGSVGAMLRKRKSDLPSIQRSLFEADQIKAEINDIQFEIFEISQLIDDLSEEVIQNEIEQASGEQTEARFEALEKPIKELVAARKEKLIAVKKSLDRLFEQLFDLESSDRSIATLTNEYREYINERILWIRSNNILFSQFGIDKTDRELINPASWSEALNRCWTVIVAAPLYYCFFVLVTIGLLIWKPRLRNEVDRQGVIAARGTCDTFWPTARVLVLSIVIGLTIPQIPLVLGIGLSDAASTKESGLFETFGPALLMMAWFAIPVEIFRRLCRRGGLANHHFAWSNHSVELLRRNLAWVASLGSPIVFAIALLQGLDQTHRVDLIERILFVIGMIGLAVFLFRCFHPERGIFKDVLKAKERSWANQTSAIWFGALVMIPLALAFLSIWGFYYTALNLAACAYSTFVLAVVIETLRALLMRFILVRRRHVHIEASRKKREAARQAKIDEKKAAAARRLAGGETVEANSLAVSPPANPESLTEIQPDVDIDENAQEANKLLSLLMVFVWAIGLWMIWTDVLPALRALDNYTVWPKIDANGFEVAKLSTAGETSEPATASSSTTTPSVSSSSSMVTQSGEMTGDSPQVQGHRITVRDVLIFIVISIVTVVSAKSLPGLLEMLFLEHLPVDRSFRYATKALISYAIVIVGMILAFRALSISWNNVQWLATALTFGLAFGLQEIFANFVAGIILMFERPIRIGDWITVDEFTGVVTKIRTRATTIINWDRKEYVIPNKDFITGRLVNWTLSDAVNRIVIDVGVAYGSDVDQAKAILLDICQNHPKTVAEPPTHVAFQAFGDSALNLSVRTFIGDIDSRLPVIDQLHTQINRAFKEAGIEISFPQRDLHIRSVDQGFVAAMQPSVSVNTPAENTDGSHLKK